MSVNTDKGYLQGLFCQYLQFFTDIVLYSVYNKIGIIRNTLLALSFWQFSLFLTKL